MATEQYEELKKQEGTTVLDNGILIIPEGTGFRAVDNRIGDPGCSTGTGESPEAALRFYYQNLFNKAEGSLIPVKLHKKTVSALLESRKTAFAVANAELLNDLSDTKAKEAEIEGDLKDAGVWLSGKTGQKEIGEFVIIKEIKQPLVYDKKDAIEWCRENMKAAITEELDVKAFESYSKVDELPFVTVPDKKPTAQLAQKKIEERLKV